jgi:uncharacterized protein (TIGR00288 family)
MTDRNEYAESELNIALLIDADNASPDHLDEVLLVLGELGTINIRRAYGNWAKTSLKGWGLLTGLHSIVPMQQFDVVKGKSSTDMRMTIDAMDLLYRGHVDGFGIMSSDSDFLPLAQRIREDGLPVYGFGTTKTPTSFQQACTRFFDVAASPANSMMRWKCRRRLRASVRLIPNCCRCWALPSRPPSATRKAMRRSPKWVSAPRPCRASRSATMASPASAS